MMKRITVCVIIILLMAVAVSCDRRGTVARFNDPPAFTSDVIIIKDLSTGVNLIDITLNRDGQPFSDCLIDVGSYRVANSGGSLYYVYDTFILPGGFLEIKFESVDDNYLQSIPIIMPNEFGVTVVSPRVNNSAGNVFVRWSESGGADYYLVAVVTENYGFDGTEPFVTTISATNNSLTIPYVTFEDNAGDIVDAIYYIYIIGYSDGFGHYGETRFVLPDDLQARTTTNPFGTLIYGTIAPRDSIIVTP